MANEKYITYRKFSDQESAVNLEKILRDEEIEAYIENTSTAFDPGFSRNELNNEYRVKIKGAEFEQADNVLKKIAYDDLEEVDHSHYLFKFSDDELMDIIKKYDEWSEYDYLLAQKILAERDKEISISDIRLFKRKRIQELSKPEAASKRMIWWGYRLAILGGFASIIIGYFLSFQKKTLPNGTVVYAFAKPDREHGNRILSLGIFFLVLWIIIRLLIQPQISGDYYEHMFRFW
jgi:hypothetical protein